MRQECKKNVIKKAEFVKQTGWCFEAFAIGRLRVQLRWEMFRFSPEEADLKIGVPLLSKPGPSCSTSG